MPSADHGQIFKATYSGIPVYEMICKNVAVMRRKSDKWLNATQILKVAGFDKPQRTRVLEREVQKGQHEKVQGGYGKYQGTWIPMDRGIALARQYNVEHLLRPIIDFVHAEASPPLAPKHITAPPAKPKRREVGGPPGLGIRASTGRGALVQGSDDESMRSGSPHISDEESTTPSPSVHSQSSRTPSPIASGNASDSEADHEMDIDGDMISPQVASSTRQPRKRKNGRVQSRPAQHLQLDESLKDTYEEIILDYFLSESQQTPDVLVNPPPDFDPNVVIDEEGHTALHWACALGRVKVVKLLLTAGADPFKTNKDGQPPLMRGVMFANNYDMRKFSELFEMLQRSVLHVDNFGRTIFHHVIDLALTKQKTHAARYYLETLITRMERFAQDLSDLLNLQDLEGDTPLTLAARARSKRLVKMLIDHGANPKVPNNDGKSAEDYILEDERFRASPPINYKPITTASTPLQLYYSRTAQKVAGDVTREMASLLESLAATYEGDMQEKERDLIQATSLLQNIQAEILESQRAVAQLKERAEGFDNVQQQLSELEGRLSRNMGRQYRLGFEKWMKDEEDREKAWLSSPDGMRYRLGMSSSQAKGKGKAESEEFSDLHALHTLPTDSAEIQRECEALREELRSYRTRREAAMQGFVQQLAEAGTGGRMAEYRRLIGGSLGIPPDEVDGLVDSLLEDLETEEPVVPAFPELTGIPSQ
ncbi:apses-domain-containing protein [Dacryopinax primogenitus]|uniref:Apses-domain-containing protein n=1 Tax=Dacryopinax primogenitus (strain DJM 731) TaxID=1858805 RepID=M5GAT1_DACPD|nr:apses-domain-containing protein [Dacryopinax primogenitus]EJU05994.1 apses-domain-containing protein [Dacryopinax primogenitus]